MNRREQGAEGERRACRYLFRHGYRILDRNVRLGDGEIDIIARRGKLIAIVEVKLRTGGFYGSGAEAVDIRKRRRIVHAAQLYLQRNRLQDNPVRFDIIEADEKNINHIRGAFDLNDI